MNFSNRREFIKNIAVKGTTVGVGLSIFGLKPRRIFGETSGSNRAVYRQLGSTGFKVTEVGFGAMNMRDPELVRAAIDHGINYVDTAHGYMNGVNEEVVGKVMKTHRDKVFLTTKVHWKNPKDMLGMMEISLKRLQTDHVDLMLMHVTDSREQILNKEMLDTFAEAKRKGICRFVGVSTHNNQTEVLNAAVESKFWEAVLVGYNYLSPSEVKTAIEKARKAGIAIIGMKNIVNPTTEPREFLPDNRKENEKALTPAQACIKWVLNDPNIDTTIPGMTSFDHIEDDVSLMGMKMGFEDYKTLSRFSENIHGHYCHGVAGCTECSGQCPKGVDISQINRCLGYVYGYNNLSLAKENYDNLPQSHQVHQCLDCTECLVTCKHGLNLTETKQLAREIFA